MSREASEGVVQIRKLVANIAENGHSYDIDCDEYTIVEDVQKYLESICGIPYNDQLLLCFDVKLESQRSLASYNLPSDNREVFLFNKARMRNNSPPPLPEKVDIVNIPDPQSPSSSHSPHPLDGASDPALKAMPLYENRFRYHFQCGHAIYSRTLAKLEACDRFLREMKVQERALDISRVNLEHFNGIILQNYADFSKCYSEQHREHSTLLLKFGRDIEILSSVRLHPNLQTTNRKCLLDFVKEENLRKTVEDCTISHRQFESKVSAFKQEFGELKRNTEILFCAKASFLLKDLDLTMKDHQLFVNEQKSIMQALSKDVNTVRKLVDDCLSFQSSPSLRPHDAVSALGPMYESHEKNYLPRMYACENAVSDFLDFCRDKKNEMNLHVQHYMQKIAYIQFTIKDIRFKFSMFQEALKRQNDQFEHLKVVHGIGPAYRACLAEVVRRKASMKLYMEKAGDLAEKLAIERDAEIRRREEFHKVHGAYIPRDILASMGLFDVPNSCDVNVNPFDTNLMNIDLSDIEYYAPESLLGSTTKSEKHEALRRSSSVKSDNTQLAEVEGSAVDFLPQKCDDARESFDGSELVEISGTSKLEVENAKLKAELASKIAMLCSMTARLDYESLGDSKLDNVLTNAVAKTSEALHLKDEYGNYLQAMVKEKQMQCESYENRIQELERRLSDQYLRGNAVEDVSNSVSLSARIEDEKSEVSVAGATVMSQAMEEVASACSSLPNRVISDHNKAQEGSDDNMADSSTMLNLQLDSSMLELNQDKEIVCDKKKSEIAIQGTSLSADNMALSISTETNIRSSETVVERGVDAQVDSRLVHLQSALAEKSHHLENTETEIQVLMKEVSRLQRELEINRKLLDESQMNCAHLENCLHEAREEAQTHLCAADRRASEYSALRVSAVKMRGLFERMKNCILSSGVTSFADSLHALAQSLANSASDGDDDSTAEFRECLRVLAEKVTVLSRQRAELLDRYAKAEAATKTLNKELEEKKELVKNLYAKHQLEKQVSKEKISFTRLEVHEIAAFVLNPSGVYEAINRNCPHYYLSEESVALFTEHLPTRPSYIVGQVVHVERQIVKTHPLTSEQDESVRDRKDVVTTETRSKNNPYGLHVGCEYYVVTIAMLPDAAIHSATS